MLNDHERQQLAGLEQRLAAEDPELSEAADRGVPMDLPAPRARTLLLALPGLLFLGGGLIALNLTITIMGIIALTTAVGVQALRNANAADERPHADRPAVERLE